MQDRIHYLLRKYLNNSCSRQELDELFQFLETLEADSPLRAELAATLLEQQAGSNPLRKPANHLKIANSPGERATRTFPARRWLQTAAILFITAGAASTYFLLKDTAPATRSVKPALASQVSKRTARSEYKYLMLPDSSQVWLNAESHLDFPADFAGGERHVTLSGEAYFDVKHADKKPFIIHTGGVTTTVLGTAFNIKAYPGGEKITVTVTRGKVKVDYGIKQLALLTHGQELSIDTSRNHFKEKTLPQKAIELWQEGVLAYDDYPLSDILADLQRVYDVKIRVSDPSLNRMRISTSFRRDQGIESALQILSKLTDKTLTRIHNEYLIQ